MFKMGSRPIDKRQRRRMGDGGLTLLFTTVQINKSFGASTLAQMALTLGVSAPLFNVWAADPGITDLF